MAKFMIISTLLLAAISGADALNRVRGSNAVPEILEPKRVVAASDNSKTTKQAPQIDWGAVGMGVGIVAVIAAVAAGIYFALRKKADEPRDEKGEPLLGDVESAKEVDYAALLKNLAEKMSDEVGPHFEKDGDVRQILEERLESFQDKAKNFMLNEMNITAAAVQGEIEKEETGLLMEWNNAVEASLPPPSILIAGAMSPTIINFMAFNHFIQLITVGLPLFCLCIAALYIDWHSPCVAIPTIWEWLYTQTVLSTFLFLGHAILFAQLTSGKKKLDAKRAEVEENLACTEEGGFSNLKEQFIGNTIILQEALLIENTVRHSFWNMVVGIATVAWLLTTIWNFVLVVGWTFIPGAVAFHPDAAKLAGDEYCGAWMTVFVLKVTILLSVLYLFLNLATVVQWFADMMIGSKGFSDAVLSQARKADRGGTGVPVVEMLAKAFLLRGGDESLISKLAVAQHHKNSLINKRTKALQQQSELNARIANLASEEEKLQNKSKDGGDLQACVKKLESSALDYDIWKTQGSAAIEEAKHKAVAIGEANVEALEEIYKKIQEVIEEVKNSPAVQEAAAQAQAAAEKAYAQARALAEEKYAQAQAMYNDPEFQAKMKEYSHKAHEAMKQAAEEAQGLADKAIAAAKDPEFQKQLQDAAQKAMDQAREAAKEAKHALNDPELQEKLQKAMDEAKAKAEEAAAAISDPVLQHQMQEKAEQAMRQAQNWADSANAALNDPEMLNMMKGMQDKAMEAMEDAKRQAEEVAKMASDPELKLQALDKLKQAQAAAEQAAKVATDPELKKKFEEAAQQAIEQGKGLIDPEVLKQLKTLQDKTEQTIKDAQKQAEDIAKKAADPRMAEMALSQLKDAQQAAEQAARMASDPKAKEKFEQAAKAALAQANDFAAKQVEKMGAVATKQLEEAQELARTKVKEAEEQSAEIALKMKMQVLEQAKTAQAAAEQAAKMATDTEAQKQFAKAAEDAIKLASEMVDPEVKKQLQEMQSKANDALEEAKKQAEQAAAAAQDPKLAKEAMKQLKEAQEKAEEAAKLAMDPATKEKFEKAAKEAMEQANAMAEQAGEKATSTAKNLEEGAKEAVAKAKGKKK